MFTAGDFNFERSEMMMIMMMMTAAAQGNQLFASFRPRNVLA